MTQSGILRASVFREPPVTRPGQNRLMQESLTDRIRELGAVIVAHYYTAGEIQDLAEETGGFVADSLEMARFGRDHSSQTLIVAGVRFMGETAKILSPHKRVLMLDANATCSLDLGCPADEFTRFCDANPERTVVVYANTSARVKARSDWVVTSSIATDVVRHLHRRGEKILWAPDKYLGQYVATQTGADILLWDGACIVHEEFKAEGVEDLKKVYPNAAVLVHPESPAAVIELADEVGSTSQIIDAAKRLPNSTFIVATDRGLFHKLRQTVPDKKFLEAPTAGEGATCKSCARCPWMEMNHLQSLHDTLSQAERMQANEIHLDDGLVEKARKPLQRMLDFRRQQKTVIAQTS